MNNIPDRLRRKLWAIQKQKGHHISEIIVPPGWQPYDMMQELKKEDEWERGANVPLKVVNKKD